MLVDSHCHLDQLDLTPYQGDLSLAIAAAKAKGVNHMLCVCIDIPNFPAVLNIAKQYTNVFASVGLHPTEQDTHDPSEAELVELAKDPRVIAIGETGLDYYRNQGDLTWQRERFRRHIRAAKTIKKPLIVHTRDARADTIAILKEEGASDVRGVLHCFTENWEMAEQAMDLGFYISFSGIVTFKNATELQTIAKRVPLDRMLIETDAPYLAPMPHRGKSNEPAYVRYVAEYIAQLRQIPFETLATQTTKNFFDLFREASPVIPAKA